MTLFEYCDHRYKSLNIELQKNYNLPEEGELKAAYTLIQWQRTFYKYLAIPRLVLKYALINIGLSRCPIEKLTETIEPVELKNDSIQ